MKYPKIRQQSNLTVKIPGFSGGVNAHDTLTTVEDNQLTAAHNMWFKNAALRTRPGLRRVGETASPIEWEGGSQWISDRETLLTRFEDQDGDQALFEAATLDQYCGVSRLGQGGKGYFTPKVEERAPTVFGVRAPKSGSKAADEQTDYILFFENGEIVEENKAAENPGEGEGWTLIEPYVPTVSVHGGSENGSGRAYEDYNMLTGAFKCTFSPDGETTNFFLPQEELSRNPGEMVDVKVKLYNYQAKEFEEYICSIDPMKATYIDWNGHWLSTDNRTNIDIGCIPEECGAIYGCRISASFDWGGMLSLELRYCYNNDGSEEGIPLPNLDIDSIEVTAWKTMPEHRETICRMTGCVHASGNRFFAFGNPDKPNLIHWSDVNNPRYWPEENCMYLGDHDKKITAIRKQGELTVVFKEHELYAIIYSISDQDTIDFYEQSGVSHTGAADKFSSISIHSSIGCDCPGSVRLVNNRLVWATSDGKVYMLPSVNQYNERNVREVSRNVYPLLSKHTPEELRKSFAGEFGGYYVLLVGEVLYLLDAQTSAFTSFNYYTKEEGAQKALPWFRWTLPLSGGCIRIMSNDSTFYVVDNDGVVHLLDGTDDNGAPIECSFTTKMFDFDRPDAKKAVGQLYIGIGDSPESDVHISYITEGEEYTDAWTMESHGEYEERDPGFMRIHRLTPNISRVRVFGFRCDSVGAIAVGDILLKFKEQGVVR